MRFETQRYRLETSYNTMIFLKEPYIYIYIYIFVWKTEMSEPPSKRVHVDGTVQEEDSISLVDDKSDYIFWSNSEISNSESE